MVLVYGELYIQQLDIILCGFDIVTCAATINKDVFIHMIRQ